ncbi:MAG: class GN sortase [Lautropia sp.]
MKTRLAAIALLLAGTAFVFSGAWIHAKALLAQVLIEAAWARAPGAKPWAWADTTPVARLRFERTGDRYVVLAGDSGATLAFGPGHHDASAMAGDGGNMVVSAHRDTHFSLLRDARIGERIQVERRDGRVIEYAVDSTQVVDERDTRVLAVGPRERLTLVTCWPFDAIVPGGPLRWIVTATRVDAPH